MRISDLIVLIPRDSPRQYLRTILLLPLDSRSCQQQFLRQV